ncbi:hypothetical protein CI109_105069 [Kwoniella shandongensis]|uniref:Uncharacterized protein n=1 Tax=Kwoniella shandongensis TaxID=1734106 RepID=A0A5M6BY29_9TREE|nr:uncharacterized protein CI109_004331 [Kwoniella shandongensis]KAA5527271.1 hypothetical protein CI109_004331 [Kwoniella shandongensis]
MRNWLKPEPEPELHDEGLEEEPEPELDEDGLEEDDDEDGLEEEDEEEEEGLAEDEEEEEGLAEEDEEDMVGTSNTNGRGSSIEPNSRMVQRSRMILRDAGR